MNVTKKITDFFCQFPSFSWIPHYFY